MIKCLYIFSLVPRGLVGPREQSDVAQRHWERDGGGQLFLGSERADLGVSAARDFVLSSHA